MSTTYIINWLVRSLWRTIVLLRTTLDWMTIFDLCDPLVETISESATEVWSPLYRRTSHSVTVGGLTLTTANSTSHPSLPVLLINQFVLLRTLFNARCFSIYALQLKEHIIKRLFAIKATNLQTVLQLLSVLKEATAFSDVGVSPESMVIFL